MRVHRLDAVDALRGLALVWMTVFHFCFDLNQSGYMRQDFLHDPLWTWQRTAILSLFLFCAGVGQALALQRGQSANRFWTRWAQVAAAALLVSAGSYLLFPRSFIYFGVLHGMALMLILVRLSAHWGHWLWFLGAAAIAAKFVGALWLQQSGLDAWFNAPMLNWLGVISAKPVTEDYVPLLPWLGVMWWGAAAGRWFNRHAGALAWRAPPGLMPLVWLGRHSLSYYLLHQPVMIGLLLLVGLLRA